MAAVIAVAAKESHNGIIKNQIFQQSTKNTANLYAVKFLIRGKPWLLTIDDTVPFEIATIKETFGQAASTHRVSTPVKLLWAPLLEKAWSKVLGNYCSYNFNIERNKGQSALRALTGAPIFTYQTSDITNQVTQSLAWDLIYASMQDEKYMVIAKTHWDVHDPYEKRCGLELDYTYALIDAFWMSGARKMYMFKDPAEANLATSATYIASTQKIKWDDAAMANVADKTTVPYNTIIDPVTANTKGIFYLEHDELTSCFKEYSIAHHRANDGYFHSWYDNEGVTNQVMSSSPTYTEFQVVVPQYEGDLYFMVDSYYKGTLPIHGDCITYAAAEDYAIYNVDLRVTVENNGATNTDVVNSKLYKDDYSEPILLRNYQAGNTVTIKVAYAWNKGVATTKTIPMDYTVSIYSKQLLTITKCTSSLASSCDNGNQKYMDGREPSGFTKTDFILDRP